MVERFFHSPLSLSLFASEGEENSPADLSRHLYCPRAGIYIAEKHVRPHKTVSRPAVFPFEDISVRRAHANADKNKYEWQRYRRQRARRRPTTSFKRLMSIPNERVNKHF